MIRNIIKSSFFIPIHVYCGSCKNISGKTQLNSTTDPVKTLQKDLSEINIDDSDIISYSDFISSGAKFDSSKNKVKFDNNSIVNVTKLADKFRNNIVDLGPKNVCDLKIKEKLKVFIDRIIECLKSKLKEGYNLDDNNLKKLYIIVEFKSEANKIVDESSKYIGKLENNMSNIFKKCSNVYISSDFMDLPFNTDKGFYSSDYYNKIKDKDEKDKYIVSSQYLFKEKTNKEGTIDLNEKAGVNNYYGIINLKDYKDYYVYLKK